MNVYGFWNARKKSISDKQIGGSFIIVRSIDEHNNHFTKVPFQKDIYRNFFKCEYRVLGFRDKSTCILAKCARCKYIYYRI